MNGLTIALHYGGGKHLYEQIYLHIKKEIREGKLLQGERLPSTRSLAEFLQVSRSTVELAYGQLVSEGYIEAKPYRGYFVCPADMAEEWEAEKTGNMAEGWEAEKTGDMAEEWEKEKAGKENMEGYAYDFSPNTIDMSAFPYDTWKKITKNILVGANSNIFVSGSPKGDYILRETIAHYLHTSRGVNCRPEQIIIGAGNDYLLMLLEKILGRHVEIAMENPTYRRAYRIFDSFAYRISPVAMDGKGMSAEGLRESEADVAYVMPSHQYPTGIVMPIGRRMELLKWAGEKEGRYLIEDDYDSEFRYMVLPLPLLRVYEEKCSFYSTTVSRIDQRILNEFIGNGHFERHLNRMRKIYREKHDLLLSGLKTMGDSFAISGENAGLHILLQDKLGRSEKQLTKAAAAVGVRVYGLSEFCVGEIAPQWNRETVILGYASLSREQIVEGLRRLEEAWRER